MRRKGAGFYSLGDRFLVNNSMIKAVIMKPKEITGILQLLSFYY